MEVDNSTIGKIFDEMKDMAVSIGKIEEKIEGRPRPCIQLADHLEHHGKAERRIWSVVAKGIGFIVVGALGALGAILFGKSPKP